MFNKHLMATLLVSLAAALPPLAAAGDARWALTLAWSPQYCKSHGNPKEPQCIESALFVPALLVPQQVDGSTCNQRTPLTDTEVNQLVSLTQNARQVRDGWRLVGGCAGLSYDEFATQFDYASRRITVPEAYTALSKRLVVPAATVREQFLQANSGLSAEGIALHCKGAELVDVSFCLTQKMKFTQCGSQMVDDCGERKIQLLAPAR